MTDRVSPEDLRYTPQHEWVRVDGDVAVVGITDHAQEALGDVVYVTLPEAGVRVVAGEACGEVESTKSVSEIYSPVSGTVQRRNEELDASPELVNRDPYGAGWMIAVRLDEPVASADLLTLEQYLSLLG